MSEWTERMREVYAHIPIMPIEELRGLPAPSEEYQSGLYFLWDGDELVYIGKSKNLLWRTGRQAQIRTLPEFVGSEEIPRQFERCTCLVLESGMYASPGLDIKLMEMERAYIGHYEPRLNSPKAMGS